jgi:hypothetical protein
VVDVSEVRKLLREPEGAVGDAVPDVLKLLARTAEVRLGRNASERGSIPHPVELEVELDSIRALGSDAAGY